MLRLNWIIHVKVCLNEAQLSSQHTLVHSVHRLSAPLHYYSSSSSPSLSPPLPSLSFKKKQALTLSFSGVMSAAATNLDPSQRSIQDEDESVRIAVRALGDMRNRALLHSPPLPQSACCAYLSYIFRQPFTHTLYSLSAYPCTLRYILPKLSNAHYTNPCIRGPRCGPRGYSPCCPCFDHPWCEHGSPSI